MARTPDPSDATFVRRVPDEPIRSSEPGRNRARRSAMMLLYRTDLVGADPEAALEAFEAEHGFPMPGYGRLLVEGVTRSRDSVDASISALLADWTLDRLGVVERTLLRIGMFELQSGEVPVAVVIDEAVELTRRYATPEAAKLVNGVLGAWVRTRGETT